MDVRIRLGEQVPPLRAISSTGIGHGRSDVIGGSSELDCSVAEFAPSLLTVGRESGHSADHQFAHADSIQHLLLLRRRADVSWTPVAEVERCEWSKVKCQVKATFVVTMLLIA